MAEENNRFIELLQGAMTAIVDELFDSIDLAALGDLSELRQQLASDAADAAWAVLHAGGKGFIEGARS